MTHRTFTRVLALIGTATAIIILAIGYGTADAKAVELSAAEIAPTDLAMLKPGQRVTYADSRGKNCQKPYTTRADGGYFSDVSAYLWNGHALGDQNWNAAQTRIEWADRSSRKVTFDGITFRNHTHHSVLVAGWC